TFNGIPAPILYAAVDQVNLQVPYEVAGMKEVTMRVTGDLGAPPFTESFILGIVPRQPSVLLSPSNFTVAIFGTDACRGFSHCVQPLAINSDGTINSPTNRAPPESIVTFFANGIGITNPALVTGAISGDLESLTPGFGSGCCSTAADQGLA